METDEYGHVTLDPLLPEIRVSPALLLMNGNKFFGEMGTQLAMIEKTRSNPHPCAEVE